MTQISIVKDSLKLGLLVIQPKRVIDNDNMGALNNMLLSAYEQNYKRVVVNMSDVEFLSSSGIGILFAYNKKLAKINNRLILCSVPEIIQCLLDEMDMIDLFTIVKDVEDANNID